MHSMSKNRHSCIDYFCAIPSGTSLRKTVFKSHSLRLTAITIKWQFRVNIRPLQPCREYISCINHRPCLQLNKASFAAEYVWLRQALGLHCGLLALISHCLLFFLEALSVSVWWQQPLLLHIWQAMERNWHGPMTLRVSDVPMTLMDWALPWHYPDFVSSFLICASLAHTIHPRGQSDRRRGSLHIHWDTFINSLPAASLVFANWKSRLLLLKKE